MNKNIKTIAYQGIIGSNSHAAALDMAIKLELGEVNTIEAVSSMGVVNALKNGEADYGVVAVHNIIAGEVIETTKALEGFAYTVLGELSLPIHHCIFTKNAGNKIEVVASHIQALGQCESYLRVNYPEAEQQELVDTAIGAKYLREGKLPETTAVICRKNAGEIYELALVAENIEDDKENETQFILIQPTERA